MCSDNKLCNTGNDLAEILILKPLPEALMEHFKQNLLVNTPIKSLTWMMATQE
jgi:hypothetical protein